MYLSLFVAVLVLYLLLKDFPDKRLAKKSFIFIITFLMCLAASLKNWGVGNDTYAYYLDFERMREASFSDIFAMFGNAGREMEPGFRLFEKICGIIFPNYYIYTFFMALLFTSAIGKLIYMSVKHLSSYVICYGYYLSLLFFNVPNNLLRQTIAMAFIIWAVIFIVQGKKTIWPVLLLFIAFMLHHSSIIGFVPLVFLKMKNIKFVYIASLVICPVVFVLGPYIVDMMVILSGNPRYAHYLGQESSAKPVMFIVQMFLFYFVGMLNYKNLNKLDTLGRIVYGSFALAIATVAFLWVDSDMIRITMFFSIWGILFVAFSVEDITTKFVSLNPVPAVRPKKRRKPKKRLDPVLVRRIAYLAILALILGRMVLQPQVYKFYWEDMELLDRYF